MNKLVLLALCCLLLAVGCQNQSANKEQPKEEQAAASSAASAEATPAEESETLEKQAAADNEQPGAAPQGGADSSSAPAAGSEEVRVGSLEAKLAHHNYLIKTVDGVEFVVKQPEGAEEEGGRWAKPNLSFGQWPFASGKICNSYRGNVEVEGNTLFMKNAASTMMLCFDPGLNEFEGLFYKLMGEGVEVSFGEDNSLILKGGGHELVFELADYVN